MTQVRTWALLALMAALVIWGHPSIDCDDLVDHYDYARGYEIASAVSKLGSRGPLSPGVPPSSQISLRARQAT